MGHYCKGLFPWKNMNIWRILYDSKPQFLPILISELIQQKLSHWRSHGSPRKNPSQSYHHYSCKTQVISMYLQQKNLHWYKPLHVLAIVWHFPTKKKNGKKVLINFLSLRTIFPFTKETAVSQKDIKKCKELEILGSSKGNSRQRGIVCVRKRGRGEGRSASF